MNILIVSQYFFPEEFLINEISYDLVERGHKVTVLTGLPNYPQGKIFKEYEHKKNRNQNIKGVEIIRSFLIPRKKSTNFNLTLNYLSFSHFASRKVKKIKGEFDIVLFNQLSPITAGNPAVLAAKRFNIPLLLYCKDVFPESIKSRIKRKKSLIFKYSSKISKKIYNAADRILVTSKSFFKYHNEVNDISYEKMRYLPQHSNSKLLKENLQKEENGYIDLMFAGNIGVSQNLDIIIEAVKYLKINNIKVHIVGDGSYLNTMKKKVEYANLLNQFIFYGRIPNEKMNDMYKKADALLITLANDSYIGNTIPSKLQNYMSTGKPVLGSISGSANVLIKESNCGLCVEAGDVIGFAGIIKKYIDDKNTYDVLGKNGRFFFVNNFTKEMFMEKLITNMKEVIDEYN